MKKFALIMLFSVSGIAQAGPFDSPGDYALANPDAIWYGYPQSNGENYLIAAHIDPQNSDIVEWYMFDADGDVIAANEEVQSYSEWHDSFYGNELQIYGDSGSRIVQNCILGGIACSSGSTNPYTLAY